MKFRLTFDVDFGDFFPDAEMRKHSYLSLEEHAENCIHDFLVRDAMTYAQLKFIDMIKEPRESLSDAYRDAITESHSHHMEILRAISKSMKATRIEEDAA